MPATSNPIREIVKATGLPQDIWPPSRSQLHPDLRGNKYDFESYTPLKLAAEGMVLYDRIEIHPKIIAALQRFPAKSILGHATLVRTGNEMTIMTSIAEAAYVSFNESYCDLMWVVMQTISQAVEDGRGGLGRYKLVKPIEKSLRWGFGDLRSDLSALREERDKDRRGGVSQTFTAGAFTAAATAAAAATVGFVTATATAVVAPLALPFRVLLGTSVVASGMESRVFRLNTERAPTHRPSSSRCLGIVIEEEKWFLVLTEPTEPTKSIRYILDWLEFQLGGTGSDSSTEFPRRCHLAHEAWRKGADSRKMGDGCWRSKILDGNILALPLLHKSDPTFTLALPFSDESKAPPAFDNGKMEDFLLLTAAALWSLFDNALERVPDCRCTFKAAGKGFLQCRGKTLDGWLLWHTFLDGELCGGKHCGANIRIALNAGEAGERVDTTSSCALGWGTTGRSSPHVIPWEKLCVTAAFKKNTLVKYTMKDFQVQAQLSVPVTVSPQIGGLVTFAKHNYVIANSINHDSIVAMERAAAAVVLLYDETRGVHLTVDGADIIEICCMQTLKDIGYDTSNLPNFSHETALLRLDTWYSSNFISIRGKLFTGDQLVRQATRRISEMIETTKKATKDNSKLIYWTLEDVIRGDSGQRLKSPHCQDVSWYRLAFAAPPLILAVGALEAEFLTRDSSPLSWSFRDTITPIKPLTAILKFMKVLGSPLPLGGVLGNHDIMKRWFLQGQSFMEGKLIPTSHKVSYGNHESDTEAVYEIHEITKGKMVDGDNIVPNCQDHQGPCFHYIQ
ncbi:hypothetical protein TWF718_005361 [Orbilia javanica]|uniref:Uncharacterized protein n=1 Tax=Orbilia javanica TaxID=47235 RepID=A0AAN8N7I8_9PEZI